MSGITQAFLVGGVLLVVAGLIVWRTRRAGRSPVVWMREANSRIAHAIRRVELRAGLREVDSAGFCGAGPWPVVALMRASRAERCAACVRAVDELKGGSP